MNEKPSEPDQQRRETAGRPLRWHIPPEEIEAMSEQQLREHLIELNEKVTRLYDAIMLEVHQQAGTPVKPKDIDDILNPEKLR